jgi:hypothetical protein|tara:strand:- start:924 stop:2891 length:1968 start_codon:yes stop_codon:yes gene_type:complete
MELRQGDIPSMDNYYNSTNWEKIKNHDIKVNKNNPIANLTYLPQNENFSNVNESFTSLTGEVMNKENLKHNNMQKFIKGSVTQNTNIDRYIIDNNKDVHKLYNNKKELENFFQPTAGYDLINGSKFDSTFLKDRSNSTLTNINNNVFPIEQKRVGPGINDGFNDAGSGGFHNFYSNVYSKPKNIDDLRVKNNQKEKTFGINYNAPKNEITKRAVVKSFTKNKPEKVYNTDEKNWFKTTGANLKSSNRPIENLKHTNKQDLHPEYSGGIKYTNPGVGAFDEYGKNNIMVYDNERQTTEDKTVVTNFTSMIKSIISPLIDGARFTTKEYTIDAPRETGGNLKGLVEKPTTYDPINHISKTTIKETTIHDNDNSNLKGHNTSYSALQDDAKTTVKETTIHDNDNSNLKGPNTSYSALQDDAKTTVKETTIHDSDILNLKADPKTYLENFDKMKTTVKETVNVCDNIRNIGPRQYKTYVYDPDLIAKTTVKETTIIGKSEYGFLGGLLNKLVGGYFNKEIELNNTNKQFTSDNPSRGNVSSVQEHRQGNRNHYYEAPQDDTRETILIAAGHTPNPGNMNISVDSSNINMKSDKNQLFNRQYGNIGKIYQNNNSDLSSSVDFKKSITKENIQNNAYAQRLDSNIMKSLKTNELNININPI